MTPEYAAAREQVWHRQGGRCAGSSATPSCWRRIGEVHHRQRRTVGPDCPCNLLGLCPRCHADVHAHPDVSRARGWIVSAYANGHPGRVPVRVRDDWLVLACDGRAIPAVVPGVVP